MRKQTFEAQTIEQFHARQQLLRDGDHTVTERDYEGIWSEYEAKHGFQAIGVAWDEVEV
jgi:hypothetical protein